MYFRYGGNISPSLTRNHRAGYADSIRAIRQVMVRQNKRKRKSRKRQQRGAGLFDGTANRAIDRAMARAPELIDHAIDRAINRAIDIPIERTSKFFGNIKNKVMGTVHKLNSEAISSLLNSINKKNKATSHN